MSPVNFFNRSLISYALCKSQSRACGMSNLADVSERKNANSVPLNIDAPQTTVVSKRRKLKKADWAVRFFFIKQVTGAVAA